MFDSNMCYKFISEEWNKAFATNTSHGFIGKSHYDIFPDTPEIWRKRHQAAMRGEIQTYLDEKATHVSEKPIWVEGSIHPWYAMDGSIGGVFVNSNIVTDRIHRIGVTLFCNFLAAIQRSNIILIWKVMFCFRKL